MLTQDLINMGILIAGEVVAARAGLVGSIAFNALLALKTFIYDPYKSEQDKENMLYYGPDAMEKMKETDKKPSDNEIAPLILDYQIKTLIPLLGSQGLILPDKNHYDWSAMKPIFFDAEEVRNKKKGEKVEPVKGVELKTRLFEAIIKQETGIDLYNPESITKNLKDKFVENLEREIKPVQRFFDKKIHSVEGSLSDDFIKVQQMFKDLIGADDHGATIVIPTVTNNLGEPGMKNITGDGLGLVRTTDTSLRHCQSNYALAC